MPPHKTELLAERLAGLLRDPKPSRALGAAGRKRVQQELTLAETGRLLLEHEATVSRQLARTRRAIREDVERQLRAEAGMSEPQIAQCFHTVMEDPGPLDVGEMLDVGERKESEPDRSP